MVFNSGKDHGQQDGNESEKRGEGSDLGEGIESPWKRENQGDDARDHGENDSTGAMVADSIEVLGTNQDMHTLQEILGCGAKDAKGTRNKYLNESVVQQEHDCGQIPDNS